MRKESEPLMEFGLALDLNTAQTSLDRRLDAYVPLLHLAERYGFTSVWAGETYPTAPGGTHLPSPLLALAALAPRTTTLRLGTGVTLLPAWQPLRLAYDAAVLDQLSGGRFVLGVGAANAPTWARFGVDRGTVGERMDETLAALRALWAGAPGYEGRLVSIERGIAPLPLQPGGPPIWVGGLAPRAARRAAQYGDAWTASTAYRLADIRAQVARYRAALTAAGEDATAPTVGANRLAFLAETPEKARAEGRTYLERVLGVYARTGGLLGADGTPIPPDAPLLEAADQEVCLVGSPETVNARLEEYARAGVTNVQLRVAPADLPSELIARTITLAGEAILPRWRR
jgi:alkanesulfonate monooxygenase SsuD/methylene tetrahydromethanopterin reductase-like flavin-dependent oxidoreductase (luciferase family)